GGAVWRSAGATCGAAGALGAAAAADGGAGVGAGASAPIRRAGRTTRRLWRLAPAADCAEGAVAAATGLRALGCAVSNGKLRSQIAAPASRGLRQRRS